jgi:hypothetical protein
MWRRWLLRLRGKRPYREPAYPHPDLTPWTRMPWWVRLKVFVTGQGAVDPREDLRGRWLVHRKVLMVALAVLLAWLFAQAAEDWHFLEG